MHIIPMHYDTFPVIGAEPNERKHRVEELKKAAAVMAYGEEIEL